MKYGLIYPHYGKESYRYPGYNIGDAVQTICVMQFYEALKIPQRDIVYLYLYEVNAYRGEKLIVPMVEAAVGIGFALLPLSPDIIPIFVSTHFAMSELTEEQVDYLKQFEPIGCRDEYGFNLMQKYGVNAYISGCMTLCLSSERLLRSNFVMSSGLIKRQGAMDRRPFLIDVPEALQDYIPNTYKRNAVILSHLMPLNSIGEMTKTDAECYFSQAEQRLYEYLTSASIVVSSRLHALVPCIAMGIPVVGVFENISYRFSWLDRLIPLYSEEDFNSINWNPEVIDVDCIILKMKELVTTCLLQQQLPSSLIEEVSSFWKRRNKSNYGNYAQGRLRDIHFELKKEYIIWGCGLTGQSCYKMIQKYYPNAKLVAAIDTYLEGDFHGTSIKKPSFLSERLDAFIILATYAGKEDCYNKMDELGKKEGRDYVFIGTMNG